MDDHERNLVELVDEEGKTVQFEHLMTLAHEDKEYVMLTALENTDDSAEDEVFILRIDQDDQGEDCYVTIDDEDTLQAVFEKFVAACEQDEFFDEDDDEDADEAAEDEE